MILSQSTDRTSSHSVSFYLLFLTLGIFTTKGIKNNNNIAICIALFTDRPGELTTSDVCSTKSFSFEAVLEKTSVTDLMEMVWKTVPCSTGRS